MKLSVLTDILADRAKRPTDASLKLIINQLIISERAMLLRQEFNKSKGRFPQSTIMSICVDLELVNSTECCDIDLGCKIPRTKIKLPQPVLVRDEINFNFVGSVSPSGESFGYIKPEEVKYIKHRKFSGKKTFYTYINEYIALFGIKINGLDKLKLRYTPSNPIDLLTLCDCCTDVCFDVEDNVFIEDVWVDAIIKLVLPIILKDSGNQIMINKETPELQS